MKKSTAITLFWVSIVWLKAVVLLLYILLRALAALGRLLDRARAGGEDGRNKG